MLENLFSLDGKYARAMNWIWNIFLLSVLWLVCCVPIITIGASTTAAYYTAAKVIRHKTGRIITEFFSSFRSNFVQSVPLTLGFGLVFTVVLFESLYLFFDSAISISLLYIFYMMALTVAICMEYLWACLSRFSQSSFPLIRMSVILVFRHLFTTVLLLLLHFFAFFAVFFMPWGILVFPGLKFYLETFLMEKVLLRYSPSVSDGDPEAQKWYYQ